MKMSFTKKPMKPITMKPRAVRTVILLNSARRPLRSGWGLGTAQEQKARSATGPEAQGVAHLFDQALCTA